MNHVLADDEEVPRDAPRALKPWGKPFLLQTAWHTAFPWAEKDEEVEDDSAGV